MPLQEELEKSGAWLFRWRSYLPLLIAPLFVFTLNRYKGVGEINGNHLWELVCFAVSLFGLLIRAMTIGHAASRTSGRNVKVQVADKLNTTGMYSLVRNPLYLGNFFMLLGILMFTRSVWAVLVFALLFFLYYERIIFTEEAFLRRKFGEEYIEWANRTPAFWPVGRNYVKPELPFSLIQVLRREGNGFFAVILILFALDFCSDWLARGKPTLETLWLVILAVGLVIWVGLRFLRKRTKLLRMKDR